jgi:peptide/nickel transport system substrate-binding protein
VISSRSPRRRLSALALLLTLAALLVSACGSSSQSNAPAADAHGTVNGQAVTDLYGALPKGGTPTGSGTITMGQISGDTPTYVFPVIPDANATDGTGFLVDQLFIPLYNAQVGGVLKVNYATSAALPPRFSDGGRRVTIHIRPGYKWSDGSPVTSTDVLFDLALLRAATRQSAANWDQYTPGLLPDNVKTATAPNPSTLVLTFKRAYNQQYLLGDQLTDTLVPLPVSKWDFASAHGSPLNWRVPANATRIYGYLNKQAQDVSTFATNPLWKTVDGPFSLKSFSTVNGSFTLARNPGYDLTGHVRYDALRVETYTSVTSTINALRTHALDVGVVDFSELGEVPALHQAGYSVYGYPNIGTFGFILNFKDRTDDFDKIIAQGYVRQALSHLEDQPAYLTGVFKGAGSAAYGPLPSYPETPWTPASAGAAEYPYSLSAARQLLTAHGWKVVPGGQTVCAKAGSGAGECGAGIPAGTPFKFNIVATPASESESIPLETDAFASAAKQAGIEISIGTKNFNYQTEYYNDADAADDRYRNVWAMANWGEYPSAPYYTGSTIFNSAGTENFGGYSSPTADRLINAAQYGKRAAAATAVASYLQKSVPMLFLPCADVVDAVSSRIGGTSDSFLALTQDVFYPQYWYVKK